MTRENVLVETAEVPALEIKKVVPSELATESKTREMTSWRSEPLLKSERSDHSNAVTEESDDEEQMLSSQATLTQPLSQTDETIRRLEKEGELDQVFGSQSMLSQELICSYQRSEEEEGDGGFQLSQATESSTAMARRLGLLSQEDRDDNEGRASPKPALPPATEPKPSDEKGPPSALQKTPSPTKKPSTITDTPFRESECFGSLLEAVEKITRQEEMNAKMIAWEHNATTGSDEDDSNSHNPLDGSAGHKSKRKLPLIGSASSSPKKSRKSNTVRRKETEQRKAQEIAKRAAALAEQTITDPEMAKKLLLSMALVRENPRSIPSVLPPRGAVVPEGFFWAHYPPLEAVLKEHMAEYYDLSTTKCQSAQQQAFNNDLVILVRGVAKDRGWKFHQTFTDKGLRDRIRCYYKTHIQNAKKRLRTMVRNPTKRANARHLCAHLDLIEQHGTDTAENSTLGSENDDYQGQYAESSIGEAKIGHQQARATAAV